MDPVPRHLELDRRLAEEGGPVEVLQVYGDWLLEQQHSLGEWITDAIRAEQGDPDARHRGTERRFAATKPEKYPAFDFGWRAGVVARIEFVPTHFMVGVRHAEALYSEPWVQLATSVRLELTGDPLDLDTLRAMTSLPPSVGCLAIEDQRMPASPDDSGVDLSHVELPWLCDLRLRLGKLSLPPQRLDHLKRLELCVLAPTVLVRPLPALQELHLWSGVGRDVARALIEGAPRLHTLGLHHQGPLTDLFSLVELPHRLRELVVAVPRASRAELEALRRWLPATVRTVRLPWVAVEAPLTTPFTPEPAPDQPVYIV